MLLSLGLHDSAITSLHFCTVYVNISAVCPWQVYSISSCSCIFFVFFFQWKAVLFKLWRLLLSALVQLLCLGTASQGPQDTGWHGDPPQVLPMFCALNLIVCSQALSYNPWVFFARKTTRLITSLHCFYIDTMATLKEQYIHLNEHLGQYCHQEDCWEMFYFLGGKRKLLQRSLV